ncbi:hypothetical protein [Streptomyces sp. NPDC101393]|uniref:hypothetical protein n=1 Tax=Streptomyces sp. NPDC101393 TaxID=3366141 RepID=UPI00380CF266
MGDLLKLTKTMMALAVTSLLTTGITSGAAWATTTPATHGAKQAASIIPTKFTELDASDILNGQLAISGRLTEDVTNLVPVPGQPVKVVVPGGYECQPTTDLLGRFVCEINTNGNTGGETATFTYKGNTVFAGTTGTTKVENDD